ncbi:MAG: right-handed parallel beta-helix repeat-containing protein [Thermodesulfobacteriota bacterium]
MKLPVIALAIIIISSGSGPHQANIQNAIDTAAAAGGGEVRLDGRFYLTNSLLLRYGVTLSGKQGAVLEKCPGVISWLTSDALVGDLIIEVDNTTGLTPGMGITIAQQIEPSDTIYFLDSLYTITDIQGNSITLDRPLEVERLVENLAYIKASFPVILANNVENASIKNLAVTDGDPSSFIYVSWLDGGIYLLNSKNVSVDKLSINGFGNTISLDGSFDISINNCHLRNAERYGIHVGSWSQRTYLADSFIENNRRGIYLCWGANQGLYSGNYVLNNKKEGIGIGYDDKENTFQDNRIECNEIGVLFRELSDGGDGNVFQNCLIENNERYGFKLQGRARNTRIQSCSIINNGQGVFVACGTEDAVYVNSFVQGIEYECRETTPAPAEPMPGNGGGSGGGCFIANSQSGG